MYIGVHFFSILFIVQFFFVWPLLLLLLLLNLMCVCVFFSLSLPLLISFSPFRNIRRLGISEASCSLPCIRSIFFWTYFHFLDSSFHMISFFFHFAHIFPFLLIMAKPKKHNTYIRAHMHATLIGCKEDAHSNVNVEVARSECIPCNSIPCFTLIILLMLFFLTYLFSFSLLFFFVRGSASGVGAHVHHILAIISERISKPNGMSLCTVYWSIRIVSFCSYCCGRLFFFGCLFCLRV